MRIAPAPGGTATDGATGGGATSGTTTGGASGSRALSGTGHRWDQGERRSGERG
jgi:hypothetical protein